MHCGTPTDDVRDAIWASGRCDSLDHTPDEQRLADVADPDGREVVLFARIWAEKVVRDHPELAAHLDDVIGTVAEPDHVEQDALPARVRFYRREVGPSRWLLVVVSFEQKPGRIVTALANRKDPKLWKP